MQSTDPRPQYIPHSSRSVAVDRPSHDTAGCKLITGHRESQIPTCQRLAQSIKLPFHKIDSFSHQSLVMCWVQYGLQPQCLSSLARVHAGGGFHSSKCQGGLEVRQAHHSACQHSGKRRGVPAGVPGGGRGAVPVEPQHQHWLGSGLWLPGQTHLTHLTCMVPVFQQASGACCLPLLHLHLLLCLQQHHQQPTLQSHQLGACLWALRLHSCHIGRTKHTAYPNTPQVMQCTGHVA